MTFSGSAWSLRVDGTPGPAMRACLRAATAAPSVHNTQPWLFRLLDGGVEVVADERRRLAVLDPHGREMTLSLGAAVCNLRVTMQARGRRPITHLLPFADRPEVVAVIGVGAQCRADPDIWMLAAAVRQRRTNRRPFRGQPVPEWIQGNLVDAARAEGASLVFPDEIGRHDVLSLADAAESTQRENPDYLAELAAWTGLARGRLDGVPASALGPRPDRSPRGLRDFGAESHGRAGRFPRDPTIAVLYTNGDDRLHWLRAGMAMQRVLLSATAHGLATTVLTQPVEVAGTRTQLSAAGDPRTAQVVLRLGFGPRTPPTPRRPLDDVLVRVA
jgi:nitroreductase